MCGIAAIFCAQPLAEAGACIERMTNLLQHRGPDAGATYVDSVVALGHRRLSILDLSPEGNQPMWDASGRYGLVYNGEVYNYQTLKAQLPDYPFRSGSDTEVLLAAFTAWGVQMFERLNGIFAFVLYDKQEQKVYAVRDRFGIKPLYFTHKEGRLLVASEQRALLGSGLLAKKMSPTALHDYLYDGCITGTQRLSQDVQQLRAGHYLEMSLDGTLKNTPYHVFFNQDFEPVRDDLPVVQKEVRNRLLKAVESQLVSDVPLGAFLSGGIDSSAIVALMSEVSSSRPLTFTIGFQEKQYNESSFAEQIARQYNTEHTTLTLSPNDFLEELPAALHAMDTVTLDGLNSYVVSKMTRKAGVTVALSGLGGDELFAGYSSFSRFVQWQDSFLWKIPAAVRRAAAIPLTPFATSSKYRRVVDLLQIPEYSIEEVYSQFRGIFDRKTVNALARTANAENPIQTYLKNNRAAIHRFPLLSQYSIAEMTGYTQHMLLKDTDQMSMASGLEVRVPFFDNDLVDYVLRVPDALKFPSTPKKLLVDSLEHRLPANIVNRPKMGFTLPWDTWMRGELHPFCDQKIESLCDRGILDSTSLRNMWQQFQQRQNKVLWSHIWMFVVLENWLQRNLD